MKTLPNLPLKGKNKNLQVRMTVLVTAAVLSVSSVILLIIASWVQKDYEKMVHDRISDDITAITRIMEQKLVGIERATCTMATLASQSLDNAQEIDSVLCHSLKAMGEVQGVSMIFRKGWHPQTGWVTSGSTYSSQSEENGYYERYAYHDDSGKILLKTYINGDELERDPDWVISYHQGRSAWSKIDTVYLSNDDEISFVVPLDDKDGNRVGLAYSSILTSYLTSFVTEYKTRKDIDISIYKADGSMVVAPDDYILHLSPEEMIVQQSTIPNIGWKVVLSADKKVISTSIRKAMLMMILLFLLMFLVIYLAIRLTVRYVARPFIERQQRTDREKAVMENEMNLAAGAQKELIPHVFPPFPDRKEIDLSACLHPARMVGGDIYDYFISAGNLYFCIGDVSGKGVQASLFMAAAHYLFRSLTVGKSIAHAAEKINSSLCMDNEQCRFITFWMGRLDLSSGVLEYVNAGHDSPILLRDSQVTTIPGSEDVPLGVMDETEFTSGTFTLMPDDILFLYTDGITEAMDATGHEFGKARLNEALRNVAGADTTIIIENVLGKVRQHSSGVDQSDDITMLCLKARQFPGFACPEPEEGSKGVLN